MTTKTESHRAERVGDAIQVELAKLCLYKSRDPRFTRLTITEVVVSRDLAYAKVYVTLHDEELDAADVVKALNKAAKFFRHQLAKSIQMRAVPELKFLYDASRERGEQLSALIEKAVARDDTFKGDESETE